MPNHGELPELAATVLQPGFAGTTAPDWVRRWLGQGLGGVALFARNVQSPDQVAALTAQLRAERPDVIVAHTCSKTNGSPNYKPHRTWPCKTAKPCSRSNSTA